MEKPFLRPISLTSCASKLFERIILSRLLFFLKFHFILSPHQAGFCSTLYQILYLSQSVSDGFNKPKPGCRKIFATINLRFSILSGFPLFFTYSFWLAYLLALLVGLNLPFPTGAFAWFFKITKVISFEFVEVLRKDVFLALFFSFFPLMIFVLLCLLSSAVFFMLTTWPFALIRLDRCCEY